MRVCVRGVGLSTTMREIFRDEKMVVHHHSRKRKGWKKRRGRNWSVFILLLRDDFDVKRRGGKEKEGTAPVSKRTKRTREKHMDGGRKKEEGGAENWGARVFYCRQSFLRAICASLPRRLFPISFLPLRFYLVLVLLLVLLLLLTWVMGFVSFYRHFWYIRLSERMTETAHTRQALSYFFSLSLSSLVLGPSLSFLFFVFFLFLVTFVLSSSSCFSSRCSPSSSFSSCCCSSTPSYNSPCCCCCC